MKRSLIVVIACLLSLQSIALPLGKRPVIQEVMSRMEPEFKTFLCYCDYGVPYGKIDTSGCDSDGYYSVVGNIIPHGVIQRWLKTAYNSHINPQVMADIIKSVGTDPLNMTIFSDATYPAYSKVTTITGAMDTDGSYGRCPFRVEGQQARVPDGRMAEIARTALYIQNTYKIKIPEPDLSVFIAIHENHEPSEREIIRNVKAYQWNGSWNNLLGERRQESPVTREIQKGIIDFLHRYRIRGE